MKFSPLNKPFRLSLGERGEMIAHDYLAKAGFRILEKNYRCKIGEMDVIAKKNSRIVFVEIKTRSQEKFGRPEESVHPQKQKKLLQVASWYLKERKKAEAAVSFAVLSIQLKESGEPEIRLIEDAFGADNLS